MESTGSPEAPLLTEEQKLVIDIAARFMETMLKNQCPTNDVVYANRSVALAKAIVTGATNTKGQKT